MNVGELFVLFGVKTEGFGAATAALGSLRSAALSVASIDFVKGLVEGAATAGTHLASLAAATGLSAEAVQEWGAVSEKSGSNLNQFAVGVGLLEANLRKLANGHAGKQLASSMSELGMSAADARSALASPEGLDHALMSIADRMNALGNTPERAALARQLFGARGARAMLADLANGSEGIAKIRDNFKALGGELSSSQVANLKGLNSSFVDLKASATGLANRAIATLAPVLVTILEGLARIAAAVSRTVIPALEWLGDHWTIVATGAGGLVIAFLALKAEAIASAVAAIGAWTLAALPFIVIAAIVSALFLILVDLYNGFVGGRSIIFDFWDSMVKWAENGDSSLAKVVRTLNEIIDKAKEAYRFLRDVAKGDDPFEDSPNDPKVIAEKRALQDGRDLKHQFDNVQRTWAPKRMVPTEDDFRTDGYMGSSASHPVLDPMGVSYDVPGHLGKGVEESRSFHDRRVAEQAGPTTISVVNNFAIPPGLDPRVIGEHVHNAITDAFKGIGNSLQSTIRGGKTRS